MYVTADEVDPAAARGNETGPVAGTYAHPAAPYAGVRPLVASDDDPSGRSVSRGIVVLDHATRDGLEGFVTITAAS